MLILSYLRLEVNPMLCCRSGSDTEDSDPDGKPLDDITSVKQRKVSPAPAPPAGAFIKSKWETVDPEQVDNKFQHILS